MMNSIAGLLFLYLKILLSAGAEKDTRIERRSTLGAIITKKGFFLKGFSFKHAKVSSFTSCGQVCLKDPRCISTNFNLLIEDKRYNCELNSAGLQDDDTLVPHRGVVFSQYAYKKHTFHDINEEHTEGYAFAFTSTGGTDAVSLSGTPDRALTELTICLWMKTNQSSDTNGTPLSYTANGRKNEIAINDYKNFNLKIGRTNVGPISVSANDGRWHHICLTWRSSNGSWNFYKDGTLAASGSPLNARHVIKAGGCLVLGQSQKDVCGLFKADKRFFGLLANVNIWDQVLSYTAITAMSHSCYSGIGNVVQWLDFSDAVMGNVEVTPSTCKPES